MNLEQAKALRSRDILHYTEYDECRLVKGKEKVSRVRVNGEVKTWKKDQNRVKVPIKQGLYVYGYLTEDNMEHFHLESECPLLASQTPVDPPAKRPYSTPKIESIS